jgi:hypothetical protein
MRFCDFDETYVAKQEGSFYKEIPSDGFCRIHEPCFDSHGLGGKAFSFQKNQKNRYRKAAYFHNRPLAQRNDISY